MNRDKIVISVDSELRDLVPTFLDNRRADLEKIWQGVHRGDFEQLRVIGHSMKGIGGGYGFDAITELGAEIELGASDKDERRIKQAAEALAAYLESVEVVYE